MPVTAQCILQLHLPNFHKHITISTLKIGIDKNFLPINHMIGIPLIAEVSTCFLSTDIMYL